MLNEVVGLLCVEGKKEFADGTIGCGGHAEGILSEAGEESRIWGMDRDENMLGIAKERLMRFGERVKYKKGIFEEMKSWVPSNSLDGVILDLGVNSVQIDSAARGFSFSQDGALDMRMDQSQSQSAEMVVNEWSEVDLANVIWKYGEERKSRAIARGIMRERLKGRITTTGKLAECITKAVGGKREGIHPATRTFQALRIAVNDEIGTLERGLPNIAELIKVGGRLAVISFHSIEDRTVKLFGMEVTRSYRTKFGIDDPLLRTPCIPTFRWVEKKPITPTREEIRRNSRSRSAKLRVLERVTDN